MNNDILKRIAAISAIIAVVSLLIATVIGFATGTFQSMASGNFTVYNKNSAGSVTINEKKSMQLAGIHTIKINTVDEDIIIREGSGDSIKTWLHGSVSSAPSSYKPQIQVNQQGTVAEIYIERKQYRNIFSKWNGNLPVLEVSIPTQFAGKLSAESVSSDIILQSRGYESVSLKTVSGDIKADSIKAVIRNVNAYSTSGDVLLTFIKMPKKIAAETVSGDVYLGIPSDAKYALDAHSVSGDIISNSSIISTQSGKKYDLADKAAGDKANINAKTVSGDIEVKRNL